jgi:transposase
VLGVEQWAEIRRLHFVAGVGIKEIARRTGLHRQTIRRAVRSDVQPRYRRPARGSKLDPYREEIHRLLGEDPRLPGTRVRELLEPLGYDGSKTILDDYLREVRPLFVSQRAFQRTVYRPGEVCQFDLWQPRNEIPVGYGQTRRGWVVVAALGYSRAGAGALIFSKQAEDILSGMTRCLWRLGGVAQTLVWDREGALHAGDGRASDALAGYCGSLGCGWYLCRARDPQAKGVVERLQGFMETSFEPGRRFANHLDYQHQLDEWFSVRANGRVHKTLRCRPADRLGDDIAAMRPLPTRAPETDHRWVVRVPADPYLRFDTCDYSLDPAFVGRRVEVRASADRVTAVVLDTGELACDHSRSYARHRTLLALEHARGLHQRIVAAAEPIVEQRPLSRYDELIPA